MLLSPLCSRSPALECFHPLPTLPSPRWPLIPPPPPSPIPACRPRSQPQPLMPPLPLKWPLQWRMPPPAAAHEVYPDAPPNYQFGYSVSDAHTGDVKSQEETRQGDAVKGSYSLIEADGSRRIVEYTADDHSGFNAVVHREPAAVAVKAVAPVVTKVAAPLTYAAPVAKYAAAPALSYSSVATPYIAAPHYAKLAAPALYH
ncbi:hypothetical protein NQ318_001152 [Aromia moschata]|uniref:Cuticle protein n=1 Tax=Aromia moschata TaxID=1265417 RepID=A0AAV8ZER4_9CUCU|nr:hypothetical protein NQ318_001152 [Aromia moschata]